MDNGLLSWFSLGHPRYRGLMAQLLLVTTLAGGLVYAQNNLLTWLTQSLAESLNAGGLAAAAGGSRWLSALLEASQSLGISQPLLLLLLLVMVSLLLSLFEFRRVQAVGQLRIRSRNDLESQVLGHLLRQDDAFFASHAPAETVNRINIDLNRVSERRPNLMRVWWCLVLLVTYLIFFCQKDWRLALVIMVAPLGSAMITYRLMARVKKIDRRYLHEDDLVKASFEDYLRASPEIQVGRLYQKISRKFGVLQQGRATTFMRFVTLTSWLRVGDHLSGMLALAAAIAVVMYYRQVGQGSAGLALLPVVLLALPDLFKSSSDLIFLYVDFQLARTSMHRLLEYETREPRRQATRSQIPAETAVGPQGLPLPADAGLQQPPPWASSAAALRLEDVTFHYQGPDQKQQGGVRGLNAVFSPSRWLAIVGPAGCGKSTLLQLLLGRVQPEQGLILYGSRPLESCESILPFLFSFMPQSPALLNATIRENLLFGKTAANSEPDAPETLSAPDLEVVEATGLGSICRLKALDMLPGNWVPEPETAGKIANLRGRARRLLGGSGGPVNRTLLNSEAFLEVNPSLSWRENLFPGEPDGSRQFLDQALLEIIAVEGLDPFFTGIGLEFPVGRLGGNLSGGQGQLVALGRTLLRRTPVLILDEPTSSLDPVSSARVARLLQQWKSPGRLIISVSHNPDFVRLADEIYLMEDGRIAAHGTFQEIEASSVLFRRTLEAQ